MPVSNVEKFRLSYSYNGTPITVNGQRFEVEGKVQLWIPVLDKKGFISYSMVLWENLVPGQRFFRYPLPEPKETRMLAIIKALESQLKPIAVK